MELSPSKRSPCSPTNRREVLATMLGPAPRSAIDGGLRTRQAVAKHLHMKAEYAETQKRLVCAAIGDYILESETCFRPADWTPRQQGVWIPEMQGFLMGLFGTTTAEEVVNYKKVAKRSRRG